MLQTESLEQNVSQLTRSFRMKNETYGGMEAYEHIQETKQHVSFVFRLL